MLCGGVSELMTVGWEIAGRGRLSARVRIFRMHPRDETDRGPDLRRRHDRNAYVYQRDGQVWRLHARPTRDRCARPRKHEENSRRKFAQASSQKNGFRNTETVYRITKLRGSATWNTLSKKSAKNCAPACRGCSPKPKTPIEDAPGFRLPVAGYNLKSLELEFIRAWRLPPPGQV